MSTTTDHRFALLAGDVHAARVRLTAERAAVARARLAGIGSRDADHAAAWLAWQDAETAARAARAAYHAALPGIVDAFLAELTEVDAR